MLTMKDFIAEDDPLLHREVAEVSFPLSKEDRQLAQDMRDFLINSQNEEIASEYNLRAGVGLAAPQIGQDKKIFAIYIVDYDESGQPGEVLWDEIVFNPKITRHSVKQAALKDGEGCLSVNREVPGFVPRPKRVTFSYQDIDGKVHELSLSDYEAIVFQHEMDHLKGIMFYDHIQADDPWANDGSISIL